VNVSIALLRADNVVANVTDENLVFTRSLFNNGLQFRARFEKELISPLFTTPYYQVSTR